MKKLKRLICIFTAVALAMAVLGCGKKTAEAEPESRESGIPISVTVNIDGSAADEEGFSIGGSEKVEIFEGDSALDALIAAGKNLGYEIRWNDDYVTYIGDLGEKSCGPASGWMYDVNGEMPSESIVKYIVNDGDTVTFSFWK
ncbi:MAG: DUF4430 domain-containing protein [Lachnospiraceae bacterium]|nr:DUF4430 domain-containing protein [Lachnospiraceae bacterium]